MGSGEGEKRPTKATAFARNHGERAERETTMIRAVPSISIHPRRVAFYLAAEESFSPFHRRSHIHPSIGYTVHCSRPLGRPATSEKKGRSPPCVNELNSQPTNPYRRV
jgi:hypothetical protein